MDLLAFERKLDATIMRKRLDIQEALKRPMKVHILFINLLIYALKTYNVLAFVSFKKWIKNRRKPVLVCLTFRS